MKRRIMAAILAVIMLTGPCVRPARAQFMVTDVPQILASAADAASNLMALMDQLGLSEENLARVTQWKETIEDWSANIKKAQDFINEVTEFQQMVMMIESHVRMIDAYTRAIYDEATGEFDPYALTNILNNMTCIVSSVDFILEALDAITAEEGIDKAQKQNMIESKVREAQRLLNQSAAKLNAEITFMQDFAQVADLINLTADRPAGTGVNCYGAAESYVMMAQETDAAKTAGNDLKDGGSADSYFNSGGLGSVASVWFRIVSIIVGIVLAGSLIFAFSKFAQGTPGAEMRFVRIAVSGVILLVVFMMVNNIVFKY